MSRGWASAWATASLVISWNSTRRTLPPLPSCEATCQAMASPSRSGSVASSTRGAALAAFLISASVLAFSLMVTYSGAKSLSTSTPSLRVGRSRRWPTVAFTVYPRPRYFPMVLALVGDSTMTRVLPGAPAAGTAAAGGAGGGGGGGGVGAATVAGVRPGAPAAEPASSGVSGAAGWRARLAAGLGFAALRFATGSFLTFLTGTAQPFFKLQGTHLYHPAFSRASRTTSVATCSALFLSVSTCASALR